MDIMLEKSKFLSDNKEAKERTRIPSQAITQCCFKTSNTRDKSSSILFEFADGIIIKSFDYINLSSKHYDRNIGILLFYTNATVTIYGSHLDKLFLELNDSNVTSINEHMQKPKEAANDEVVNIQQAIVETIKVKYKDSELENDITEFERIAFIEDFDEAV